MIRALGRELRMGDQKRMNSLVLSGERKGRKESEMGRGCEEEKQPPVGQKYGGLTGLQG